MKIAVSATKGDLDANVDLRFARCPYYIIFEIDGDVIKKHEIIKNMASQEIRGAGIIAAQTIANKGVEVIITGNIGPNAFNVLSSAGIKIISNVNGNVKDMVEKYLKGKLKETKELRFGMRRGFRRMGRGRRWNQKRLLN